MAVDFERDDVGEKLAASGFQQNSPSFFTWLGVVPYLTEDAIGRTLDYMSSIQGSEVVFDYLEPPEAFSEELRQIETERAELRIPKGLRTYSSELRILLELIVMGSRKGRRHLAGRGYPHPLPLFLLEYDWMVVSWGGSAKNVIVKGIVAFRLCFARTRSRCRAHSKERQGQTKVEEAFGLT